MAKELITLFLQIVEIALLNLEHSFLVHCFVIVLSIFSFGYYIVCPSSICRLWLLLWYLQNYFFWLPGMFYPTCLVAVLFITSFSGGKMYGARLIVRMSYTFVWSTSSSELLNAQSPNLSQMLF